jgi:hypothetical protein
MKPNTRQEPKTCLGLDEAERLLFKPQVPPSAFNRYRIETLKKLCATHGIDIMREGKISKRDHIDALFHFVGQVMYENDWVVISIAEKQRRKEKKEQKVSVALS